MHFGGVKMKLTERTHGFVNKYGLLREALVSLQICFTDRKYAVMASGHGSKCRFDGPNPDKPPFPLLNLKDAVFDCRFWEGYACTIGGGATIVNIRSGEKFDWRNHLKYDWVNKREVFDLENRLPISIRYFQGSLSGEELKKAETEFEGLNEVFNYEDWKVKKMRE